MGTQVFQPIVTALPLFAWFIQWKISQYRSKRVLFSIELFVFLFAVFSLMPNLIFAIAKKMLTRCFFYVVPYICHFFLVGSIATVYSNPLFLTICVIFLQNILIRWIFYISPHFSFFFFSYFLKEPQYIAICVPIRCFFSNACQKYNICLT